MTVRMYESPNLDVKNDEEDEERLGREFLKALKALKARRSENRYDISF